jgi:hypothetical protein
VRVARRSVTQRAQRKIATTLPSSSKAASLPLVVLSVSQTHLTHHIPLHLTAFTQQRLSRASSGLSLDCCPKPQLCTAASTLWQMCGRTTAQWRPEHEEKGGFSQSHCINQTGSQPQSSWLCHCYPPQQLGWPPIQQLGRLRNLCPLPELYHLKFGRGYKISLQYSMSDRHHRDVPVIWNNQMAEVSATFVLRATAGTQHTALALFQVLFPWFGLRLWLVVDCQGLYGIDIYRFERAVQSRRSGKGRLQGHGPALLQAFCSADCTNNDLTTDPPPESTHWYVVDATRHSAGGVAAPNQHPQCAFARSLGLP